MVQDVYFIRGSRFFIRHLERYCIEVISAKAIYQRGQQEQCRQIQKLITSLNLRTSLEATKMLLKSIIDKCPRCRWKSQKRFVHSR